MPVFVVIKLTSGTSFQSSVFPLPKIEESFWENRNSKSFLNFIRFEACLLVPRLELLCTTVHVIISFSLLLLLFLLIGISKTDGMPRNRKRKQCCGSIPYRICIQELPGSGSVFGIRVRIHTCKYRIKWRPKM